MFQHRVLRSVALRSSLGPLAFGVLVGCLGAAGCTKSTPGAPLAGASTLGARAEARLASAPQPGPSGISWRYEVNFDGTRELAVEASF
ncbi:MAG: hypothetical protein ABJB12_10700, partial [Pseudomonadota bacterium]